MKNKRIIATSKKSTRDALRQSEEKYHMLLELAVDAIFQGDPEGNFILVNDRATELTGYSKDELLSMNIIDLFDPELLLKNPLRYDLLSSGRTIKVEREINRKDKSSILVEMISKAMPDGTYQSIFRDVTERRKIENAVIASELKYRNLHMSMMDGYAYCDMSGKIRDTNEAFQMMIGYDQSELSNLTYEDLTPVKWHGIEAAIVSDEILKLGHSRIYQKEYIKKDGTVFPVELHSFLIRNEKGESEGMWAIIRDITKRQQAEETIRKSEEKFRNIVESSPNGMHIYQIDSNNDLILIGANPSADSMLGISHAPLIGSRIDEAFPSLRNTDIPETYRKVALGEIASQAFEIPYQDERISGYYSVHVFRTGTRAITVDFSDISRRRATEEALIRSEIEYRDTLDSLPDWIYVVDEQYKIAMVNAAVKDELVRHGMHADCIGVEIVPNFPFISHNTLEEIKHVFNTGVVSVSEQKIDLKGKSLHAEITRVPIMKDGKVVKVILMIRDRSKENEIEELKARNAEQKEVMLREIHHRVKNNLAIVISLLNFQLRNNTNEELTRMIIDIQMRIRSMALIHEHLYRSENLDRIPLASYIDSLAHMIMTAFSGHHVTMVKELDPIDVSIETALPIGLIINELLTNAFKYAFPGGVHGEILVRLEKLDPPECSLIVEDNGIGLPESSSMDNEKSLGLYIVRLLVEQLDGSVSIIRGKGTAFNIRFLNLMHKKPGRL